MAAITGIHHAAVAASGGGSSLPASAAAAAAAPLTTDEKIAVLRAGTLTTIRSSMPIDILFTPELKIDLSVFVKDQMLLHRLAEFLAALPTEKTSDTTLIAASFAGSELLDEVRAMFKYDPDTYLIHLYEALTDVLNGTCTTSLLTKAFSGRIFTLKNALIALQNPDSIIQSQTHHKLRPHTPDEIRAEGAAFIRETLLFHLYNVQNKDHCSFEDQLATTAEKLAPFVRRITTTYLLENDKVSPKDPLTFRNPHGNNHHGLVAASIMEVCLQALGYDTKLLVRDDLEPRVTLATAHGIVQVKDPTGKSYVVDPCYIQFYKDIFEEEAALPKRAVLVMPEDEVSSYVHRELMSEWSRRFALLETGDPRTKRLLESADQILAYAIHKIMAASDAIPTELAPWVEQALLKAWKISNYTMVAASRGLEEIFFSGPAGIKTRSLVDPLNLPALTSHLPFSEVHKRLEGLLEKEDLHYKNSPEALSLIAKLPTKERARYAKLLDVDPRIPVEKGVDVTLNAYFRSLKKSVNPEGKDLKVIYGCSGADCLSVMLATDAKDLIFVDATEVSFSECSRALAALQSRAAHTQRSILEVLEDSDCYFSTRAKYGGCSSRYDPAGRKHAMKDLSLKLLYDLKTIGVDLDRVTCEAVGSAFRLSFYWNYAKDSPERERSLLFVTADITNPDSYPSSLKAQIAGGFDIFYLKAAYFVPRKYNDFLPSLLTRLRPNGFLMTTDRTMMMETITPEQSLDKAGIPYKLYKPHDEIATLLAPSVDPLTSTFSVERFPPEHRHFRTPGSNLFYWSILSLRQILRE